MLCCVVFQQSGTPIIHPYADEGFPDETLARILQPLLLRANGGGYPWSVYRIGYAQLYVCALTNSTVQYYSTYINAHSHHDVALGCQVLSPIESLPLHVGC